MQPDRYWVTARTVRDNTPASVCACRSTLVPSGRHRVRRLSDARLRLARSGEVRGETRPHAPAAHLLRRRLGRRRVRHHKRMRVATTALSATATRLHCRRAVSLAHHPAASARLATPTATATATLRHAMPHRRALALVVHSAAGDASYYDPNMPLTPRMKKHLRGHANALGSKLCVHQVRGSEAAGSP